jgi:Spy/CpxP family protein refolding chaperone
MAGQAGKKKRRWRVSLIAGSTVLLVSFGAAIARGDPPWGPPLFGFFAGPPPMRHHQSGEGREVRILRHVDPVLDRIDASAAQREAIHKLFADEAPTMREAHESQRVLAVETAELLSQDELDRQSIDSLREKYLEQAKLMAGKRFDLLVRMAEILTPEQRRQLVDFARQRFETRPYHHDEE